MTIKQRLYISNILMLVIPVLLSAITIGGIIFVFEETPDVHDKSDLHLNDTAFFESVKTTDALADKWSKSYDLEKMKRDVKNFNEQYGINASLSIYQGKNIVYPSSPVAVSSILDAALSQGGNHLFFLDNTAIYCKDVVGYRIVLTGTVLITLIPDPYVDYPRAVILLFLFILLVAIIIVINRFLTQFVFKSIIMPLDSLVYGVRQIRDGNLNYHIEYTGKDEFSAVCSDFNEMAQHLMDSVNTRQKDEANRRELIAGISHDLRTPLTSIKAYVEGIEKGVAASPEAQKRYLEIIKNKASDLEHIVNHLFLFSKLDIGEFPFHMEKMNIGEELRNLLLAVSDEYEKKGLTVSLTQNVENVYIQADVVQLRNAIVNILENSVKYKNKEQGNMKIVCHEDDKYVTLTLTDNGPGVSSGSIEKLFDAFYRCDPSRSNPSKGSGLGLAITAKILERLGGTIQAENVTEGGLAIIMKMPKYTRGESIEKNSNY